MRNLRVTSVVAAHCLPFVLGTSVAMPALALHVRWHGHGQNMRTHAVTCHGRKRIRDVALFSRSHLAQGEDTAGLVEEDVDRAVQERPDGQQHFYTLVCEDSSHFLSNDIK